MRHVNKKFAKNWHHVALKFSNDDDRTIVNILGQYPSNSRWMADGYGYGYHFDGYHIEYAYVEDYDAAIALALLYG